MIYHCCEQLRRNAVDAHPTLNGVDYLEVLDRDSPEPGLRQRTLLLRLLKPVPAGLDASRLRVEGGERVRNVVIQWAAAATAPPAQATAAEVAYLATLEAPERVLVIRTDRHGDFSTYTLRLVRSAVDPRPPAGFDPLLTSVEFSFKVECPSDFDCRRTMSCGEELAPAPAIDYLSKDYASFRRLVLDRIAQLIPGWQERSAADLGVTLAELIAYVGDQLSYQQDAVATEAYLETAHRRSSRRRHALLVDYAAHEGCNARVWLHVAVRGSGLVLARDATRFASRVAGLPDQIIPGSPAEASLYRAGPVIFEALHDATLHAAHNRIDFHAWGDRRCCLPRGATKATLAGHLDTLAAGDVLLFEEMIGPATGLAGDADPDRRHVVRLTYVNAVSADDATQPLTDPLTNAPITEIAWSVEDALPFPLCISSTTDREHGEVPVEHVSVARGNMVLADHGYSLPDAEELGQIPAARLAYPPDRDGSRCDGRSAEPVPVRFIPPLAKPALTFAGTVIKRRNAAGAITSERLAFDPEASAAAAMTWAMDDTLPQISVASLLGTAAESWRPRRDLLASSATAPEFVVEVEDDGSARLRFGDGRYGRRPQPGERFSARYRVGNGRVGNVGADTVAHVVHVDPDVLSVRNPLPAGGGRDPEDAATVRRRAPQAFRRQERAVTADDYGEVTERYPGIQRAAATLRWTGSWYTVFVTVDRDQGAPVDPDFEAALTRHVDRFRMAGRDTEINDPVYVSLEIELLVCVLPEYLRAEVQAGLSAALGSRMLADGRRGHFHPDNLSFGQTVHLSRLYAAARQVSGVASVNATVFQRQGTTDSRYLADGYMELARLEIPRLDNDANYPEHGVLRFKLYGGK